MSPPFLQGLTVWYHRRPPMRPQILSLTLDRSLREDEYALIAHEVSVPQLTAFFPGGPEARGPNLVDTTDGRPGRIREVAGRGRLRNDWHAAQSEQVQGRKKPRRRDRHRGRIRRGCRSEPIQRSDRLRVRASGCRASRGWGRRSRQSSRGSRADQAGPAVTRDCHQSAGRRGTDAAGQLRAVPLERRPLARMPGEPGDPVAPLPLPDAAPTPTPANSWVTYDDHAGRFHFRHPQELELSQEIMPNPNAVKLQDVRPAGSSFLALMWPTARGDTKRRPQFPRRGSL